MMRFALVIALSLFALANAARAALAAQQAVRLPDLPVAAPAPYVVLTSVIWAAGFAACAFGLARSRHWAPRVTIVVIVLYQANLWLNHLVFTWSPEADERAGFGILLSVLSIAVISGAALQLDRQFAAGKGREGAI